MNHDDPAPPRVPHPFFHTMVMMGSALALGCGGLSGSKTSDDDAGGGGTGGTTGGTGGTTAGTGGTTGATGGSSVGGAATAGMGGSGGTVIMIGTGGTGNVPIEPGPFPCAPETWTCNTPPNCGGRDYLLPSDCACDDARPASAADCAADQNFVCHQAGYNESYQAFTKPVPFSCSCVPSGQNCEEICDQVYGSQAGQGSCRSETTGAGADSILCGCAPIVLR